MRALGAALLGFLVFLLGWINWLLRVYALASLAALVITSYGNYTQFAFLRDFAAWVNRPALPLRDALRGNVPTSIAGFDVAPILVVLLVFVAWFVVESQLVKLRKRAGVLKMAAGYNKHATTPRKQAPETMPGNEHNETIPHPSDRAALLELYARTKKALEAQKQMLSFLSIDVVGSTKMKEHEDAVIASRDFGQYKLMVEGIIERHNYLKASWTPDGVMICFDEIGQALGAGQDVLRSLAGFNRDIKAMRSDFKVRLGINAGEVLYDEEIPMEEMSDRVIDIAGHMQKYAKENSIFINKDAIAERADEFDLHPAAEEVDDCEVLVWTLD